MAAGQEHFKLNKRGEMDPLLIKREPDIRLFLRKDDSSDRRKLLRLKAEPLLGGGVSVIYIYSLVEEVIGYPNCPGSVIYIGEACRVSRTADRFGQHICPASDKGGDTGANYTISRYYWLGKKLELKIYILKNKDEASSRQILEALLLKRHLKVFGALPIAQGASGENYKVSMINELDFSKLDKFF